MKGETITLKKGLLTPEGHGRGRSHRADFEMDEMT